MRKQILTTMLISSMVLGVTGCNNNASTTDATTETESTSTDATESTDVSTDDSTESSIMGILNCMPELSDSWATGITYNPDNTYDAVTLNRESYSDDYYMYYANQLLLNTADVESNLVGSDELKTKDFADIDYVHIKLYYTEDSSTWESMYTTGTSLLLDLGISELEYNKTYTYAYDDTTIWVVPDAFYEYTGPTLDTVTDDEISDLYGDTYGITTRDDFISQAQSYVDLMAEAAPYINAITMQSVCAEMVDYDDTANTTLLSGIGEGYKAYSEKNGISEEDFVTYFGNGEDDETYEDAIATSSVSFVKELYSPYVVAKALGIEISDDDKSVMRESVLAYEGIDDCTDSAIELLTYSWKLSEYMANSDEYPTITYATEEE